MSDHEANNWLMNSKKQLFISMFLVSVVLTAKLFYAFKTNSLALFSDSWHLMTDLASLTISWLGLKLATKPANHKYTFGHFRHSILTALINNISLIIISIFILYKAVERYLNPVHVEPKGMILMAVLGLIINTIIVLNLKSSGNINVKSAFLHFVGDALADVGVLIGGLVIYFTGWVGIDTLLSAILACLILKSAVKMTLECIRIMLEAAPENIEIEELRQKILALDGVKDVSDLHVWSLSVEMVALTAHVCVDQYDIENCDLTLQEIQWLLKDEYNIEHTTIQFEPAPCSNCFFSKAERPISCTMCIDSPVNKSNIALSERA